MVRQHRRSIALVAIAGLLVGLLPATVPAAAASGLTPARRQALAYWTAERMAAAVPRDFVRTSSGFIPAKRPGGGGGGKPDSTAVTGTTWTAGGQVREATGKVYFEMAGSAWICSGTVIADPATDRAYVLTAAHCAYDETREEFASLFVFIPDFMSSPTYSCADTAHGCWVADALVVDHGYAAAGGFTSEATRHDFAVAVITAATNDGDLEAVVGGGYPIDYPAMGAGWTAYAFGYPAAGRYKGAALTYCAGQAFTDAWNDDLTWGLACAMTGGSSGGPWFAGFDPATTSGTLASLNSYGYSGRAAMFGPIFDADTLGVVTAARGASGDTIVE